MTDKPGYVQIGIDSDEQSFSRFNRNIDTAANQMNRLTQVNTQIARSADEAGDRLNRAFASMKSNIDNDINAIQKLRLEVQGAGTDMSAVGKKSAVGAPGGGGEGGFNISGARRAGAFLNRVGLPEVGTPLQFIGGLQSLEKTIDSVGVSVKAAIPAMAAFDTTLIGVASILAPIAILVGGVAIGVKLYNDSLEASTKALADARVALDTYYKAIQDGTTNSISKQLDTLKQSKTNIDAQIKDIQTSLDKGFASAKQQFGGDLGGRLATAGLSASSEEFRKLGDRLKELQKQSSDLDGQMQGLATAEGSAAVKANDLAEATLKAANITADSQINQYKLIREGTTKQIQGIIDDNKDKIQVYTQELATLNGIKNPNDSVKQRIQELNDLRTNLENTSAALTQNVLPVVKARETEAAALKVLDAAQKAHLDQVQKEVAVVQKLDTQIAAIKESDAQSRIQIAEKLGTALVKAAQDAVDSANKALEQLEQKRADNLTSLEQDQAKEDRSAAATRLDDQIQEQRKERDSLQSHLEALQAIRDRDKARERDDLLNRNYRDIFSLKEQQNTDSIGENNKYVIQIEQSRQALQDRADDQKRAQGQQRQERLISYQQANADAVKQYNIELAHAQQANRAELNSLTTTTNQKIQIVRSGAKADLQILMQTEQAKQQLLLNSLKQIHQLMGAAVAHQSGAFNSPANIAAATPYADGGFAAAGSRLMVNDGRNRESFNGSMFPPGLGLFIPATSGYVNSGKSGGSGAAANNNTFIIQSHDPQGVRREVLSVLKAIK